MSVAKQTFGVCETVDMSRLDRGVEYYAALQAADCKDFEPLKALIERTIAE